MPRENRADRTTSQPLERCPACGSDSIIKEPGGWRCNACSARSSGLALKSTGVCPECGTLSLVKKDLQGCLRDDDQCAPPFTWFCRKCLSDFEACGKCSAPRLDIEYELGREFHCEKCGSESPHFREAARQIAEKYALPLRAGMTNFEALLAAVAKPGPSENLDDAIRREQFGRRKADSFHNHYKRICNAVGVSVSPVATASAEAPLRETSEISAARMFEVLKHFRLAETKYFAEEIMKSKRPLTVREICTLLDARNDRRRTDGVKWIDYYNAHREEMWEIDRSVKRTLTKLGVSLFPATHVKSNSDKVN